MSHWSSVPTPPVCTCEKVQHKRSKKKNSKNLQWNFMNISEVIKYKALHEHAKNKEIWTLAMTVPGWCLSHWNILRWLEEIRAVANIELMLKIAFQIVSRILLAYSTSVIQELSSFMSQAHLETTWVLPDLIFLQSMFPHLPSTACESHSFKKMKVGLNNNNNNNKN